MIVIFTITALVPMVTSCSHPRRNTSKVIETMPSVKQYAKKRGPVSIIGSDGEWFDETFQYADITIKLPAGWDKASDESMERLHNAYGETDIRFLMYAVNPVTEDNILLSIQYLKDLPPEQAELLDEKSFLTLMKPGIGNDEGEALDPEIKEAVFGGKTYTYLTETKEIAGVPCTQYYVARKIANEIIILLFTCDPGVSFRRFCSRYCLLRA